MPPLYVLAACLLFLFTGNTPDNNINEKVFLKCYGNSPCAACTSCNYCAHCNAGGTCGVCKDLKKESSKNETKPGNSNTKPATKPVVSSSSSKQCKATTKKGTRCSRNAKASGYCWQHEG